jgi:hypothetical protein
MWLAAAPGASFSDNPNKLTNALAYNSANGVAVRMTGSDNVFELSNGITFRFTGLQVYGKTQKPFQGWNVGGLITIENCIVCSTDTIELAYLPTARYVNSLFYNAGQVIVCASDSSFYGCTLYTASTSTPVINNNGVAAIIYDCAFFGGNAVSSSTNFITASNNATNQASVGFGTANQVGLTAASQFQSVTPGAEDFRVKTGSALINNGIRQQTYTNDLDIVGSARSTTTPTIGAWEFASVVVAPPDTPIKIDTTVGNAVAGGPQGASVSQNVQIEMGVGNAVAAGLAAAITQDFGSITCTPGNAVACGYPIPSLHWILAASKATRWTDITRRHCC